MLAAIRRPSSRVSSFAAESPPRLVLEIDIGKLLAVVIAHDKAGVQFLHGPGRIANDLSLKVIDTYDVLRNANEKRPQLCNGCRNPSPLMDELWYLDNSYHHTPLGNELVCSYLFEQGFSQQTTTFRPASPSTMQ